MHSLMHSLDTISRNTKLLKAAQEVESLISFQTLIMERITLFVWVTLAAASVLIGIEGRTLTSVRTSRPAAKTIKTDNGDIFDCVDIYKQPAFDHPRLKDHMIQMKPSRVPEARETDAHSGATTVQFSTMSESCPDGTVPVHRVPGKNLHRAPTLRHLETEHLHEEASNTGRPHEIAIAMEITNRIYGTQARINCWQPRLEFPKDYSSSQIWIRKGGVQPVNSIEAGVIVHPSVFGDNQTRLFVYWTKDVLRNVGCYNLQCPGFVQVDQTIALGVAIKPLSVYGGAQQHINIQVFQDPKSSHWWLRIEGIDVGYWPRLLFQEPGLPSGADRIGWGGIIYNSNQELKVHTATQMGSGHFSIEGYAKASYVANIKVDAEVNYTRDPGAVYYLVSKPNCYDLTVPGNLGTAMNYHLYHGGPGRNQNCQ